MGRIGKAFAKTRVALRRSLRRAVYTDLLGIGVEVRVETIES